MPVYDPKQIAHNGTQSQRDKERETLKPAVQTSTTLLKKSTAQRLLSTFLEKDSQSIKDDIWNDVLKPTLKKALYDIIANGASTILGEKSSWSGRSIPANHVNYGSRYSQPIGAANRGRSSSASIAIDDVLFNTRSDAENVLDTMFENVATYGSISVNDFYDLSGISNVDYTVSNYGWTDLRGSRILHVSDRRGEGFVIKLPRAIPLES